MAVQRPTTALTFEGSGILVEGTARSVALVLNDARRHGDESAWFQAANGSVEVKVDVPWVVEEVEAA